MQKDLMQLLTSLFIICSSNLGLSAGNNSYDPSEKIRNFLNQQGNLNRNFEEIGLAMKIPGLWDVEKHYASDAMKKLVFTRQTSLKGQIKYKPNMVLYVEDKAKTVVETHPDWFNKVLYKKFGGLVKDFEIVQSEVVEFEKDHPAIVAYAKSKLNGVEMHHMHFFISSKDKSYFFNYTNIGNWEKGNRYILDEAWKMIIEAKINGKPSYADYNIAYGASGVIVLLILGTGFHFYRRRQQRKLVETYLVDDLEYWQPSKRKRKKSRHSKMAVSNYSESIVSETSDPFYSNISYGSAYLG